MGMKTEMQKTEFCVAIQSFLLLDPAEVSALGASYRNVQASWKAELVFMGVIGALREVWKGSGRDFVAGSTLRCNH